MGFFQRIGNLWTGFWSLFVSDLERKNPEIAYENAINGMVRKYATLKEATAALLRRRDEITERLQGEEKELAQIEPDLGTALDTNQDDLALGLLQKKNALDASTAGLRNDLERAGDDAEEAKASLVSIKDEIGKLKAEKDRMLAKVKSAEARLKIQGQLDGLSVDAEVQALDNVREHIKTTIASADLHKEMGDADLDNRLRKLREQSGDASAKRQLEELKRARQQAQAEPEPGKSM